MFTIGRHDWSTSNIRTWLNSADEVVHYNDQPPMPLTMSEHKNGYHNEAGFLNGFTEEELAAIDNDGSNWYTVDAQEYGVDEYYWWLREPVEGTASKCYMVTNGYTEKVFTESNVGAEGFGIRPAITVSLESDIFAE